MWNSHRVLSNPRVSLAEIVKISRSSYYDAQKRAMLMIIHMPASTPEVCDALVTVVNASAYMRDGTRRAASEKILHSPAAENKHLARVLICCKGDLKHRAALQMIENGNLTDLQCRWLRFHAPDLMEESEHFDRTKIALAS